MFMLQYLNWCLKLLQNFLVRVCLGCLLPTFQWKGGRRIKATGNTHSSHSLRQGHPIRRKEESCFSGIRKIKSYGSCATGNASKGNQCSKSKDLIGVFEINLFFTSQSPFCIALEYMKTGSKQTNWDSAVNNAFLSKWNDFVVVRACYSKSPFQRATPCILCPLEPGYTKHDMD